jgi:pantoate kinase
MTTAFCPSHITCFFRPVSSDEILEKGSRGAGIRMKAGTTVHINEIIGKSKISIDREAGEARITKHLLERFAPGRSFEVDIECGLPPGQGFGMSASGAIAAALCLSEITGKNREEAFEAAHISEVICGGGLGDVAALMSEVHVPIRTKAGMPPFGKVIDSGIVFEKMTLVVLGKKLSTADILSDEVKYKRICDAGDIAMERFLSDKREGIYGISRRFSFDSGVMGENVAEAIGRLEKNGAGASMCMLGNSIFTDLPEEEVRDVLGECETYSAASTSEPARIIRKA